ncbi:DM13 domain-containing protein [Rapidithrix thailandica]|uniref:DM13 domain-containing protein n=1 Tax=Rapidithrix thailandica TaxID=413964 RepID=A0AAW9SC33_9BACT
MKTQLYILSLFLISMGCIGTDVLELTPVPPRLKITSSVLSLKVGESHQFAATYYDEYGETQAATVQWTSGNSSIIQIDPQGLAKALQAGKVYITAQAANLKDSVMVEAGEETIGSPTQRTGTLQGSNNYSVEGTFTLTDNGGSLTLRLEGNFKASNGPGLHVYMAHSSQSVAGGLDLGALKQVEGTQAYTLPSNVSINTYDYVIIYCKPFGVVFGNGMFSN